MPSASEQGAKESAAYPAESFPVLRYETCSLQEGMDRFIACYNSCCDAYGNTNLLEKTGWYYSDGRWHYRQYEKNWLEPEIQLFEEETGQIREIRIGFEDHGYTEWGEALSVERAFFTLRCLNEKMSDEEIHQLILAEQADMKERFNYVEHDERPDITDPRSFGEYLLYQFFSEGVYYLCIQYAA